MQKSILIHNPRCSKSRSAKQILEEHNIEFEIVDYLKNGLNEKLLKQLPELLGLSFDQMIRTKEAAYSELKLSEKSLSDREWINILLKHPVLIERPIFINFDKAIIARPPELVLKIL